MEKTDFVKETYNRLRGDVATLWDTEIGRDFLIDIRVMLDYCDKLEVHVPTVTISSIKKRIAEKESENAV